VGLGTAAYAAVPTLVSSGTASVSSCNAGAHVVPRVGYNAGVSGYQVTAVTIATSSGCAGLTYRLSLLDGNSQLLAESTGHLGRDGSATVDVTSHHVDADKLGNIAVALTGVGRTYFR
jgi:hypothetical protein